MKTLCIILSVLFITILCFTLALITAGLIINNHKVWAGVTFILGLIGIFAIIIKLNNYLYIL